MLGLVRLGKFTLCEVKPGFLTNLKKRNKNNHYRESIENLTFKFLTKLIRY
jgi:hypothetical protein